MVNRSRKFSVSQVSEFLAAVRIVYEELSAADEFIYVYNDAGHVYMVTLESIPWNWIKHSCTDTGDIRAIVKPCKSDIASIASKAIYIGEYDDIYPRFEQRFIAYKGKKPKQHNNGLAFEYAVYAFYGKGDTWYHNSTPFYEKGDIEINGRQIQIKSYGARILTGEQLNRLQAHAKKGVDK